MPIVTDEFLVSPTAKSRWLRWQQEVEAAREEQEAQDRGELVGISQDTEPTADYASFSATATIDPAVLMTPPSSLLGIPATKEQDVSAALDKARPESTLVTTDGAYYALERQFARPESCGKETKTSSSTGSQEENKDDSITDTIGAIAVDCYGKIAAASSSGGIGMKHRGRVGPAALIGIGTAVIPEDPKDPEETTVAAVTSGTGEHIATTLAASTCASRVYFSDRKDETGMTETVTEEEAIKSMIDIDFMGESDCFHNGLIR